MRLSKIKLAGFKSFVDPTTISMPGNLIGVVGPNGCGKSNVIDAVRWVMGESSAKHLRGESLEDVIFNGSSARKPVGMAMIELIFDNSDGAVGGAYANYSEISVKRTLSRDGASHYFLNGARCRRKDITSLFLGTGLGARSYSIIEQGMVSRLIEAKPEEMRTYLEEAAGISKYKDRRRETETRIRHTRENLERLSDLRDEVDKQLKHLQRQSRMAEKYKTHKQDQRRLSAEVLVLKVDQIDGRLTTEKRELEARVTAVEAAIAKQRSTESDIEKTREKQAVCNDDLARVQETYYKHGAEIARLEQTIQHAREMKRRQERELAQIEESARDIGQHIERDSSQLAELLQTLQSLEPELAAARSSQTQAIEGLSESEEAMRDWQIRWEAHLREANAAQQSREIERTRIEHLQGQLDALERRNARLQDERAGLSPDAVQEDLQTLGLTEARQRETLEGLQSELGESTNFVAKARDRERDLTRDLDAALNGLRDVRGKIGSLEALQKAALGQAGERKADWVERAGLAGHARLAQNLSVEPGWERAVETVLGDCLEAICVESLSDVSPLIDDLDEASITLFQPASTQAAGVHQGDAHEADALADKIVGDASAGTLLAGVYTADSLGAAMALRARLRPGESVITIDGIWLGPDWLRVSRDEDIHAGVIARENELRGLRKDEAERAGHSAELAREHEQARITLLELEETRERKQSEYSRIQQTYSEVRAQFETHQARLEHMRNKIVGLDSDAGEIASDAAGIRAEIEAAHQRQESADQSVARIEAQAAALAAEKDRLQSRHSQARATADQHRELAQDLAIRAESRRSARHSLDGGLARLASQMEQLESRRTALRAQLGGADGPLAEMEKALAAELELRMSIEADLAQARKSLETVEHQLRELDRVRAEAEGAVALVRDELDKVRMVTQELDIRRTTFLEQLSETGFELEALRKEVAEDATIDTWEEKVVRLARKIERLGPINLAAIDEFKEQAERKEYLDAQHGDLSEALDTLENAIRRIDRETRTRFKETFDKVDAGLKKIFPRLFGGGHAYMQLSDDDLLNAGVTIMARPPGKRNSTIHLLSGGEKALTAVALIFSIFELNPAPFCMLDEVDAPLDDANVERFCEIVREMSDRVQFVIITHNKVTIELANHLTGVTMQEPGVSRLVAVDVDEAMQLAAM